MADRRVPKFGTHFFFCCLFSITVAFELELFIELSEMKTRPDSILIYLSFILNNACLFAIRSYLCQENYLYLCFTNAKKVLKGTHKLRINIF